LSLQIGSTRRPGEIPFSGFIGESPHGSEPKVGGRRRIMALLRPPHAAAKSMAEINTFRSYARISIR